jgi:RND superfamily putative drug exporter
MPGQLRWAELIAGKAAVSSLLALVVIDVLAIPFFSMRAGLLDASTDPRSSTTYQAYQLLAKGFGPGFNGPLELVGEIHSLADQAHFATFVASVKDLPGVAGVQPPQLSPNGKAEVAVLFPATGRQDAATTTLLQKIRDAIPRAEAGTSLAVHVGAAPP